MPSNKNKGKSENKNEDLGLNIESENAEVNQAAEDNALAQANAKIEELQAQQKESEEKIAAAEEAQKLAEANEIAAKQESKEIEHGDHDFWWVTFAAKDNPNAADQVMLGINGNILVMKRNVPVIVPSNYLQVADHAVAKQYRQLPGEERRVVGEIKTFPYTKIKPATKKEYLAMKKKGTQASKESNAKTSN